MSQNDDVASRLPAAPVASSPGVRASMVGNRRRDTAPELALRRTLHARGLRFRVDYRLAPPLRTRPDLVFTRARVAVFVDGCFWHRCPLHGTSPRAHSEYWTPKLDRNVERDRQTDEALAALGWTVVRVWEHEPPAEAADRIEAIVRGRQLPCADMSVGFS